ncbi:MAG TPA: sigma-70 family RNA polymerase sigma factor [Verrucomicrobiales bacterium]|nr:sigma-70 family RNA polymerase sigma factor [Verrucomicrobiales bacterium]
MDQGLQTRATLLLNLRDVENHAAWERFVDLYTPLIFQFCRKRGLQEVDAADVAQEVMKAVAGAIQKFEYEPDRGGFRNWLFTVTRNKLKSFWDRRQRQPAAMGGTTMMQLIQEQPGSSEELDWDHEYRLRMFHWAADRVRAEFKVPTWEAFWKTAVQNQPIGEVARALGLTEGAVYIARSRVIAKLRLAVEHATGDWDDLRVVAA